MSSSNLDSNYEMLWNAKTDSPNSRWWTEIITGWYCSLNGIKNKRWMWSVIFWYFDVSVCRIWPRTPRLNPDRYQLVWIFMQLFKERKHWKKDRHIRRFSCSTFMWAGAFFFLSQTTARLYLAINCLPWTLVTLCGVISVTFIMRLLTRLWVMWTHRQI